MAQEKPDHGRRQDPPPDEKKKRRRGLDLTKITKARILFNLLISSFIGGVIASLVEKVLLKFFDFIDMAQFQAGSLQVFMAQTGATTDALVDGASTAAGFLIGGGVFILMSDPPEGPTENGGG